MGKEILSDTNRHNFLINSGEKDIDRYFEVLERLSKTRGGRYQKMLIDDNEFYTHIKPFRNDYQVGGIFGTGVTAKPRQDIKDRPQLAPSLEICALHQSNMSCDTRKTDLDNIKQGLDKFPFGYGTNPNMWMDYIDAFIIYLGCCFSNYAPTKDEPTRGSGIRDGWIRPILRKIVKNQIFAHYALTRLEELRLSQSNILDNEFFIELSHLFASAVKKYKCRD